MTLVFDRRQELAGRSATHALVVGVSEYQFLPDKNSPPNDATYGLNRLASPALSATKVCAWLMAHADDLERPLASCRLLISPSAAEAALWEPLPQSAGSTGAAPAAASWTQFVAEAKAWRQDASNRSDDATILYFSGHGLQRHGVPLLTLADFCDPDQGGSLMRAVDLPNIVRGMGPLKQSPQIALTQFYFIDACSEEIEQEKLGRKNGSVFEDDDLPGTDKRTTPIFRATYPGAVAMTIDCKPTDFCTALLQSLERGAENRILEDPQQRWPVTTFTLNTALTNYFADIKTGQYSPLDGISNNATIRWLREPPKVDLQVVVLPDPAIDATAIVLDGPEHKEQNPLRADHPYKFVLPAGIYSLEARAVAPGARVFKEQAPINQQNRRWPVRMEPWP
jgi:hypothetical protein